MAKRRFTWLDAVICALLVVALAVAGVWYFTKDSGNIVGPATKEYEVTLRFARATVDEFDYYRVGDRMYYQERSGELGTITSLETVDLVTEEFNVATGEFVRVVDPTRKAVEMKVRVQGAVVNGKFTVNSETFHIGEVFYPQSDTTRSIITVWDIEEVVA